MYPLLETIKIKDGTIHHVEDHQDRMDQSIKKIYGPEAVAPRLEEHIFIPEYVGFSWYKCRIIYGLSIGKIEFEPYKLPEINSLELVHNDEISYELKWADRSQLNRISEKSSADDILIVKNGQITDSSYANLLFYRNGKWITPAHPLLAGTQRARLLSKNQILTAEITPEDLHHFDHIKWINAMLDLEDGPEWPIDIIKNI